MNFLQTIITLGIWTLGIDKMRRYYQYDLRGNHFSCKEQVVPFTLAYCNMIVLSSQYFLFAGQRAQFICLLS